MKYIQVDNANKEVILEMFNKSVDNKGFIIDEKTRKKIICPYSKTTIKIDDFSILPGSATFVNNKAFCFAEHITTH